MSVAWKCILASPPLPPSWPALNHFSAGGNSRSKAQCSSSKILTPVKCASSARYLTCGTKQNTAAPGPLASSQASRPQPCARPSGSRASSHVEAAASPHLRGEGAAASGASPLRHAVRDLRPRSVSRSASALHPWWESSPGYFTILKPVHPVQRLIAMVTE